MSVRIVRLGSPRAPDEGLRLGTVRFPPRGVPVAARAAQNWFDVWYPNLAPSAATLKAHRGLDTDDTWKRFTRAYRREMSTPENRQTLALLAALSHHTDFSVGCYCADEARCHRSLLRALFRDQGAHFA